MSERFPRVTIQTGRPDASGQSRAGQHGEGVILDDSDDIVYVTGDRWYGEWPIQDTDVPAIRQVREKEALARENHTIGDELTAELNAYEYLINQLQQQGLKVAEESETHKGMVIALVDARGNYQRLPTLDEFRKDWQTLEKEGLVRKDDA